MKSKKLARLLPKKPKPTHRIRIHRGLGSWDKWTSTIYRGNRVLWSSTSQLYSRKIDAVNTAKRFLQAVVSGRLELEQ